MKKNIIIGILLVVVLVFAWIAFSSDSPQEISDQEMSVTKQHFSTSLSASGDITCTYPQTLYVSYESNKITHELPKPETNPIIMTFSDMQTEVPKIRFIDSTQSISEVPVIKIVDSIEKLIFIEGNGDPYVTMHTIYKDSGVAIFEKSISLLGIPVGTIGMGGCVNY